MVGVVKWAVALGVAGVAQGMVGDAEFMQRRAAVKNGGRGLAVSEKHWILTVDDHSSDSVFCDELRENITERCTSYHLRASVAGDLGTAQSSDFQDSCIISFPCAPDTIESGDLDDLLTGLGELDGILEQDLVVHAEGSVTTDEISTEEVNAARGKVASWGLDRIDQRKGLNNKYEPKLRGHGVNIYILDTGVNGNHNEFKGRFKYGGDFIKEGNQADQNGHGSHCAGTAAGATYGVAPGANVIGVKVLSGSGSGSTSGVVKGVEWAVKHQKNNFPGQPAVISMSLGGGANKAMDRAVQEAAKAGNIVVVAAGNDNSDACRYSPARAGGKGRAMGVLTVMSSTKDDRRSGFSNYGKCADIIAPGSNIVSAWKGGANAKNTISGTSMAAPHVAGVAAQMLEKHDFNKAKAQNELLSSGVPGIIKNAMPQSPNLFLQAADDVNRPPTKAPTTGPTNKPAKICAKGKCLNIKMSTFGTDLPQDYAKHHHVVFAEDYYSDSEGCKHYGRGGRDDRLKDAVVIVRRGSCSFHQKVQRAAKAGAVGVVIYNDSGAVPFPPKSTTGDSKIWSGMISKADGLQWRKNRHGLLFKVGPPNL